MKYPSGRGSWLLLTVLALLLVLLTLLLTAGVLSDMLHHTALRGA